MYKKLIPVLFALFSGFIHAADFNTQAEAYAWIKEQEASWIQSGFDNNVNPPHGYTFNIEHHLPSNPKPTFAGWYILRNVTNGNFQLVARANYYNAPPPCAPPSVINPETGICEAPVPECGPDTYYDEVSNECVNPDDICWQDVVSGNMICEPIWPDENPEGCVMTDNVLLCLDDLPDDTDDPNEDCVIVNGIRKCKTNPDQICGITNGAYECLDYSNNQGCGYFNGQMVCIDKNNDYIPEDSPDHPKNGGNADGDPTNDPTDPRPESDGGDPNNQPGRPASDFEGVASEKTLREIRNELKGIGDTLKDGLSGGGGGGAGGGSGDGDGDGDGDGESGSFDGAPFGFEIDDGIERLGQIQGEYEGLISSIRAEISSSFGSFSGGGGLPDNNITLFGYEFNAGFSKFGQWLQYMGGIIMFAAAFISLGIIMGGRD